MFDSNQSNQKKHKRLVPVEQSANLVLFVVFLEEITIVFDEHHSYSALEAIVESLDECKLFNAEDVLKIAESRKISDRSLELLTKILRHIQASGKSSAKYNDSNNCLVKISKPHLTEKLILQIENLQKRIQTLSYDNFVLETILNKTKEQANFNKLQLEKKIAEQQAAQATLLEINQELERLIFTDGLTQIANRRHFDDYLLQAWQQLRQESSFLSLILSDIDYFKVYNDTYGHLIGDYCLQQVALSIESVVEAHGGLAARYGGEEFGIILPNTSKAKAIEIANKIRLTVKSLKIEHQKSPVHRYVTLSLGVYSLIPSSQSTPDLAIAMADKALYEAKLAGRDRARTYGD